MGGTFSFCKASDWTKFYSVHEHESYMFLVHLHYCSKVWCQQGCIYLIENTLKQYIAKKNVSFKSTVLYLNIFSNVIYSCNAKLYFQQF